MKNSQDRRREARIKRSCIGFDSTEWKSVPFVRKEHKPLLEEGVFIRYLYGATEVRKNQIAMVGKVLKVDNKRGVEIITDTGYHFAVWKRISRIYLPKTKRNQK